MVDAAMTAFKSAQTALVDALQMEYFCDDLDPPDCAFGWSIRDFEEFFKSGGARMPEAKLATASVAPADAADATDEGDDALSIFLQGAQLGHLCSCMTSMSWDECEALYKEGRPKLMAQLSKQGVPLTDRQKFANAFGKATRPDVVKGQPGGGRTQQALFQVDVRNDVGRPMEQVS